MVSVWTLVMLVALAVNEASSWPTLERPASNGDDLIEHMTMCSPVKPCKTLVRENYVNGSIKQEFQSGQMCMCGDHSRCPDAWSQDPERSITRYLHSQEKILTLQMKFCQPVQQFRQCRGLEVALTLKGYSILPNEIESVNCRCARNQPAFLQRVTFERNFRRREDFVCTMPVCNVRSRRRTLCYLNSFNGQFMSTDHLCKCPPRFRCTPIRQTMHGECRP